MKKILIVEDEPFILETYSRELSKAGYLITQAVEGNNGLELATTQKYDLILLDIMLPGTNGIDILRAIKSNPTTKDTPTIMLTNLGQESVVEEAFRIGAQGYILKINVLPTQLVQKVKNYFATGTFESSSYSEFES